MTSRRDVLAVASALWAQAVARAQVDVNAAQRQIDREQHKHGPAAELKQPTYKYEFLSDREQRTLRVLADRLIPADERSGGAKAARVDEYIDFVLGHAEAQLQKTWRSSLVRLEKAVRGKAPSRIDAYLETLAANEFSPRTQDEQFFVLLKDAVVEGFYTSQEGIQKELGYQGLGFLREFPGCGHATHAKPENYHPQLRQRG